MISLWHIGCIFTGIFSYIFFNIQMKKSNDKTFSCLAAFILSSIIFCCAFFILETIITGSLYSSFLKIGNLFTNNLLLYTFESISLLVITIIFSSLLARYPLSEVMLVLQLGVPLGALGYYFVGNITTLQQFIGIIIITVGALVSGFKKFEFPNIFKPLLSIPFSLFVLVILRSCIKAIAKVVVFIASQQTKTTLTIHHFIDDFTDFSGGIMQANFESAIEFTVGWSPFVIFVFFIYLLQKEQFSFPQMIKKSKEDFLPILIGGACLAFYTALYYYVFQTIPHKSVLSALSKFKIPFTIIIASVFLKEKITLPKKVAATLIVIGGLLAAF